VSLATFLYGYPFRRSFRGSLYSSAFWSHKVVHKDGWKRVQRTGWDSQGRVVERIVDDYFPSGQHSSFGMVVEEDGKWHGGGMVRGPKGEYITDSYMVPYDFDPNKSYGQIIYEGYEKAMEEGTATDYVEEIVYACRGRGYEIPIKKSVMYKALEKADKLCFRVFVVPDKQFQAGGDCEGQCDGWSYHPEVGPDEDVVAFGVERTG